MFKVRWFQYDELADPTGNEPERTKDFHNFASAKAFA